jgi:glycosyltransferase involved in cell wall biosynthesis
MKKGKKILFITNVDWFFISHRLALAEEARKKGYDVYIAATNTGKLKELEAAGFTVFDLKINRKGTNPFGELIAILRILFILYKVRPQVLHNITLKIAIYGSLASRIIQVPRIVNAISGLGYLFTAEREIKSFSFINLLMRIAFYKRGISFIFQNPDDLSHFEQMKFGVGNNLTIIRGSGINLEEYHCKERKSTDIRFILTARMLRNKGISEYIGAAKLVSLKYPNCKFLLVGGIDEDNPTSFSESELLNEINGTSVCWLGQRDDIKNLLQNSDVMVFPSYREGLPKSLIEASAMSLPIITTDTPGCRECVEDGVNGFLVPIQNKEMLAEKMEYLIENPVFIQRMGNESRKKAEMEFSIHSVIDKTFHLYS